MSSCRKVQNLYFTSFFGSTDCSFKSPRSSVRDALSHNKLTGR